MPDIDHAIVGGDSLTIRRTTNSGRVWFAVTDSVSSTANSTDAYNTCLFFDSNTGFMAGSASQFCRTTDAGESWSVWKSAPYVDTGTWFSSVKMPNGTVVVAGYANGSTVVRTTDNGLHWDFPSDKIVPSGPLLCCAGADACTVVLAGTDGQILSFSTCNDVWVNWQHGTTGEVTSIVFFDSTKGIALVPSSRVMLRSGDDANHWLPMTLPTDASQRKIVRLSDSAALIIGGGLTPVQWTSDKGITWESRSSGIESSFEFLGGSFANEHAGFLCGYAPGGSENGIYSTTNGGLSWRKRTFDSIPSALLDVALLSPTIAVAMGNSSIFRTSDGGVTWRSISSPVGWIGSCIIKIAIVDSNTLWAIGDAIILRSSDAGLHWDSVYAFTGFGYVDGTNLDAKFGFAVGVGGAMLVSVDAGQHWAPLPGETSSSLRSICPVSGTRLEVAGDKGNILSVDLNALLYTSGTLRLDHSRLDFDSVIVDSTLRVSLAIDNDGHDTLSLYLILSDDSAFTPRVTCMTVSPLHRDLLSVTFRPTRRGPYAGHLVIQHSGHAAADTVFLSGTGILGPAGVREKREGSVSNVDFTLSPNYPNPFHERSRITLTVNRADKIRCSIYTGLARQVYSIQQNFAVGTHEIQLDGFGLPPGLYECVFTGSRTVEHQLMIVTQ